jgi:hypothetical protein
MRKILLVLLILFVGVFAVSAIPLRPGGEPLELLGLVQGEAVLTASPSLEVPQDRVQAVGVVVDTGPLPWQAIMVYGIDTGQLQTDSLKQPIDFYLLC